MSKKLRFETIAIRTQTERGKEREHSTPIFPTSGFIFDDAEQMRALFANEIEGNIYSRYSNPNCTEFEQKMSQLEKLPHAISAASGMASIFSTFMGLLKAGDHMISSKALFGSTVQVLNNFLPNYGIKNSYVEPSQPETWEQQVNKNTKLFYVETPSNPGLEIIDLKVASAFAKANNLIFVVDNCFATPFVQTPADFGADIVIHSATKFIDGQGRVCGGITIMKSDYYEQIKRFQRQTGPSLSPFNAWILSKSLETLAVRMEKHCSNAMTLAEKLNENKSIKWVKYPFFKTHPQYEIAKKQMKYGGGLITFEIEGEADCGQKFLNNIQLLSLSANLGDTRTIVTHPASTTHSKLSKEDREALGITNNMIRVSVGLEHIDDVLDDINRAIDLI